MVHRPQWRSQTSFLHRSFSRGEIQICLLVRRPQIALRRSRSGFEGDETERVGRSRPLASELVCGQSPLLLQTFLQKGRHSGRQVGLRSFWKPDR